MTEPKFARIICVDWGKDTKKRRAWVAHVGARVIEPLAVPCTLDALVAHAHALRGRTLLAIDAAVGVPARYFERARRHVPAWRRARDFPSWLPRALARDGFELPAAHPSEWRLDRPFIAVPPGRGSLTAFYARANDPDGKLRRSFDAHWRAKSPFIVSGIPGTVGSGSRALWRELVDVMSRGRAGERRFSIWPFDGSLRALAVARPRIVLGEIYPRVCYAIALADELPAKMRSIAKTRAPQRVAAVEELRKAKWLGQSRVRIAAPSLALARASEDHFDAMMSAAALLRCVLERRRLEPSLLAPTLAAEGAILATPWLHA